MKSALKYTRCDYKAMKLVSYATLFPFQETQKSPLNATWNFKINTMLWLKSKKHHASGTCLFKPRVNIRPISWQSCLAHWTLVALSPHFPISLLLWYCCSSPTSLYPSWRRWYLTLAASHLYEGQGGGGLINMSSLWTGHYMNNRMQKTKA